MEKKNDNPHYPSWLTQEEHRAIGEAWGKIYNRFCEDVAELIQKAGGKERVSIEVGNAKLDPNLMVLTYTQSEE